MIDEKKKKKTIICSHCGYEWSTKSEKELITCPSCSLKFKPEMPSKNLPEAIKELGSFFQLTEYGKKMMESGFNGWKMLPLKFLEVMQNSTAVYPKNDFRGRATYTWGSIWGSPYLSNNIWLPQKELEIMPNSPESAETHSRVFELLEQIISELRIYRDRDLFVELFALNSIVN